MLRKARTPPFAPSCDEVDSTGQWEMRPGGMLVQKRAPGDGGSAAAPTIRVKVKFGSVIHEIYLSSESTFGELKRLVSERTGLHHLDQKMIFKDKERDSAAFLDVSGVKDGSKIVVMEDPAAQAKRLLESRRQAMIDRAAKTISSISLEVDRLAAKVTALEAIVSRGGRVVESDVLNLIELLMGQLIRLDAIVADGDTKLQRGLQVKRVQKYVETLDVLRIKNALPPQQKQQQTPPPAIPQQQKQQQTLSTIPQQQKQQQTPPTMPQQQKQQQTPPAMFQQQKQKAPPPKLAVEIAKWETFDSLFSPTTSSGGSAAPKPRFNWELF